MALPLQLLNHHHIFHTGKYVRTYVRTLVTHTYIHTVSQSSPYVLNYTASFSSPPSPLTSTPPRTLPTTYIPQHCTYKHTYKLYPPSIPVLFFTYVRTYVDIMYLQIPITLRACICVPAVETDRQTDGRADRLAIAGNQSIGRVEMVL